MLYALLGESMWSGRLEILGAAERLLRALPPAPGRAPASSSGPITPGSRRCSSRRAIGCSTAIVTYLWARQVASARWSLGVAAAVLALPALDYSAFLMTESVSLLAVTSALFLLWRSFAHPSWSNQILAAGGDRSRVAAAPPSAVAGAGRDPGGGALRSRGTWAPGGSRAGAAGVGPCCIARRRAYRGRAQREPAGRLLVGHRQACPGRRGSGMVDLAPGSARGHERSRAPRRSGRAVPAHLSGARSRRPRSRRSSP